MKETDRLIWTSEPDYRDWEEELSARMPEGNREERLELMYRANRDLLELERQTLSHAYGEKILVIAELHLWNGKFPGYKELVSGNLRDCFVPNRDSLSVRWYVDRDGDLRCEDTHHDGTNTYLYRVWKENLPPGDRERLKEKIYYGDLTRRDLLKATRRLGDEIGKVYGWQFPPEKSGRGDRER